MLMNHDFPSRQREPDVGTRRATERRIDDELAQSFPASDPPSWVQGVAPQRAVSECHERFTKDQ